MDDADALRPTIVFRMDKGKVPVGQEGGCEEYVTSLCLAKGGSYVLYVHSSNAATDAKSSVRLCGKDVTAGKALTFTPDEESCSGRYDAQREFEYSGRFRRTTASIGVVDEPAKKRSGLLSPPPHSSPPPPQSNQLIKVALVGDSITWSFGVTLHNKKYAALFGRLLGNKYDVRPFAKCGVTAQKISMLLYFIVMASLCCRSYNRYVYSLQATLPKDPLLTHLTTNDLSRFYLITLL